MRAGASKREETPHPFIKTVGGKRRLLGALCERVPPAFDTYEERFLGGGALFFHLRREGLLGGARVMLTDANERLVRTYRAVRDEVEAVIDRLRGHARLHELRHYEAWRRAAADPLFDLQLGDAGVAAWFLYANQAGYNGLYRVNKSGAFNTPYGDGSPVLVDEDNLRACSRALRGADLRCVDFADEGVWRANDGAFVYFDPPYVPAGSTASFTGYTPGGFARADQERLARHALALKRRGAHVVLTNSDVALVRELYPAGAWDVERVELRGDSVSCKGDGRGRVGELVIT